MSIDKTPTRDTLKIRQAGPLKLALKDFFLPALYIIVAAQRCRHGHQESLSQATTENLELSEQANRTCTATSAFSC